jgi:thiamine pyrophosphate-dependent acetolactate synthase large subunit-like protein
VANTLLLDNALATMGAGLPSAIMAAMLNPKRRVLAVCGDGGFMMNSQELETAVRLKLDLALIRALARGRRWMADLLDGVHASVAELAAAYGTDERYVARHLPLACLSPAIIDAILDGRQPIELTTCDLLKRIEIPLDWDDQARRLGCC